MNVTILDGEVRVYPEMNDHAEPLALLNAGDRVETGAAGKAGGTSWVEVTLPDGQRGFINGDTKTYRIQKMTLAQEKADVYDAPSAEPTKRGELQNGATYLITQVIELQGVGEEKATTWLKIEDMDGKQGFLRGGTRAEYVVVKRFRIERVAFIATAALIAGPIIGMNSKMPVLGGIAAVAVGMAWLYGAAKMMAGVGGFTEQLPYDAPPIPKFDWKRFVIEPLCMVGVVLACLLVAGAAALVGWAFSDK